MTYTDAALEAAAKLAARHLRDSRLPDSAIDLMDEAGAVARLGAQPSVGAPDVERIAARMARIPARQASSSDRERLRTLEESLQRVVFGQEEAVHLVAQAIKRSRAGLGQPVAMTPSRWARCVVGATLAGFLLKDLVFGWNPWLIRREKDHPNIIVRWRI